MPKRFHLERPDLVKAIAEAFTQYDKVSDQQRLLAMRLAGNGQHTTGQIAGHVGISHRQFFNWPKDLKAHELERGWWQAGPDLGDG